MAKETRPLILQLDDHDVARDILHHTRGSRDEAWRLGSALNKVGVERDYKVFLSSLVAMHKNTEAERRKGEEDDESDHSSYDDDDESDHSSYDDDDDNDPQYELFLQNLKECGNSYMLEYEGNGVKTVIKYEEDSSSESECDLEPRRRLRSAMKQKDGPSSQMPHVEDQGMLGSQSTPRRMTSRSAMDQKDGPSSPMPHVEDQGMLDSQSTPRRMTLRSAVEQKDGPSSPMPHVEDQGMLSSQSTPRRLAWRQTRSESKSEKKEKAKSSTKKIEPSSLGEDSVLPRRTLRSATKQQIEHFIQMRNVFSDDSQSTPVKEREKLSRRSSRNKSKSEKQVIDPDYHLYLQNLELVNSDYVMSGLRNGEGVRKKEKQEYGSYSDVEIIDNPASNKANKSDIQSEFRHKVITALRKSYNEEEYKKLLHASEFRKQEERHLDLRGGRERAYGKQKDGKSYLDYYPDLKRKLDEVKEDQPKQLNLLRGFFLWLQHPGEKLFPWKDDECLAICPQ